MNGYKRIAIYGMSYVGETLVNELKGTCVEVVYGIDQKEGMCAEIDVVSSDDELEAVDAIVVTAVTFYDEIEKELSKKIICPIVSLDDILHAI